MIFKACACIYANERNVGLQQPSRKDKFACKGTCVYYVESIKVVLGLKRNYVGQSLYLCCESIQLLKFSSSNTFFLSFRYFSKPGSLTGSLWFLEGAHLVHLDPIIVIVVAYSFP